MKKILIALSTVLFLLSCEKEADYNANYVSISDSSLYTFVKFVNAYPFATPVFSGQTSASLQLTYNGLQFSATPIAFGTAFPVADGYATVYREATESNMLVRLALGIPPAAVKDSALFSFQPALKRGGHYTFFFYDSIQKPTKIMTTEDDVRLPGGPNLYRVRFVNLIPNPPVATPAIDIYSTNAGSVIFPNIPFKRVTSFLEFPRNSISTSFTDTYQIRWAGTTTVVASLAVQLNNQMSITLYARGLVGTTGTRAPGLSVYRNN